MERGYDWPPGRDLLREGYVFGMLRAFLWDRESPKGYSLTGLYYPVQVWKLHKGSEMWPGVLHDSLHFPAESPAFIGYFLSGFVL